MLKGFTTLEEMNWLVWEMQVLHKLEKACAMKGSLTLSGLTISLNDEC